MTRKHAWWAIAVFFGLSLIANIPAALVYGMAKSRLAGTELLGLQGSWTSGEVAGITSNARLVGQDLHFCFKPLSLLLGRVSYGIKGGGELAKLDGTVSRGYKSLRVAGLDVQGNLKRLASSAGYSYIPFDGQVQGKVAKLILVNGLADSAEAQLDIKSLAWTLARDPMLLGDFHADVSTTPEAIVAKISSPAGPLDAKGEAKLYPDRRYELDVLIKLKPGASEILTNYVHSLGAADAQGYTHLRQKGTV